jgi:hypothetical protein
MPVIVLMIDSASAPLSAGFASATMSDVLGELHPSGFFDGAASLDELPRTRVVPNRCRPP